MSDDILKKALDERLAAALEFSNYRSTLHNQKENAKLAVANALTYSKSGGLFKVDQTLISFVHSLIQIGRKKAILLDTNSNPITVDSLQDFLTDIVYVYYSAMNAYLASIQSIKSARSVKALTQKSE